jgi:hypothetical protein
LVSAQGFRISLTSENGLGRAETTACQIEKPLIFYESVKSFLFFLPACKTFNSQQGSKGVMKRYPMFKIK